MKEEVAESFETGAVDSGKKAREGRAGGKLVAAEEGHKRLGEWPQRLEESLQGGASPLTA